MAYQALDCHLSLSGNRGPKCPVFVSWLIDQLSPFAPGFWLLVSFLTGALLYIFRRRFSYSWRLYLWGAHRILIPYLGLLVGALSPRLMGLSDIDWLVSLSFGLGLIFVVLVLLLLVRATVDLTGPSQHNVTGHVRDPNTGERSSLYRRANIAWQMIGASVLLSGIEEFHWSFLRGAIWEMLLSFPVPLALPAYWAVWLAAIAAALEITLRRPNFAQWLVQLTILTTTSVLFFYTRNFWLCWALHTTAQLILTPSGTMQYAENPHMENNKP